MFSSAKKRQATALILLSFACVSIKPVFSKYLMLQGWTPLSLYVLILFTTVVILGMHEFASLEFQKSWKFKKRDVSGIIVSTVFGGVIAPVLVFKALNATTATHTVLIESISPVFIVLFAMAFLQEKLHRESACGICLLLLGIIILLWREIWQLQLNQPTIFLVIAAALGSLSVILHKKYIRHRHLDSVVFVKTVLSLVLTSLWMIITEPESVAILSDAQNVWIVLGLSTIGYILPYFLYFRALENIKAFEAGILSLFSPIFTILLANWLLGERISNHEMLSFMVIMTGIVLINMPLTKWRIVPSRLLMMGPLRK